jgi:rRNA processing protein Krr1/Pno1
VSDSAKPDMVNQPPHYKTASGLEAIDVIEAFGLGFSLGNAIKYILRAGKKGDRIEDLEKSRWYLTREIERVKANTEVKD